MRARARAGDGGGGEGAVRRAGGTGGRTPRWWGAAAPRSTSKSLRRGAGPPQVWKKAVQPPPSVAILGHPPEAAGLEVHASLLHRSTREPIADGLRGSIKPWLGCAALSFTELSIEQKPSSLVRKRSAGLSDQMAVSR